ncbi:bifunctional [glutamine synthetase] adenylyltransferase/[glutamine synthetase]-adenylyl-L-tyrosine phosphorylase [Brevibacterium sp. UMB10442]|nr:bifunctional [glutamine synthetase] adenylyltransferase/[glutamine synthetase]-adenylyl-L-tyrosine phosphorylase [Brevibacterium sp. UMB10442]
MRKKDPARQRSQTLERTQRFLGQFDEMLGTQLAQDPERTLVAAADRDSAALGLVRIAEACQQNDINLRQLLDESPILLNRLIIVSGGSEATVDHLVRWPQVIPTLADAPDFIDSCASTPEELENTFTQALADQDSVLTGEQGITALRRTYRDLVTRLVVQDLEHPEPEEIVEDVTRFLSDLAAAVFQAAYKIAEVEQGERLRARIAVVAMGKCGARELNYVSDVDVIFAYAPREGEELDDEVRTQATDLATRVTELISGGAHEPALWEIDTALRPEGKSGALVRTIDEFVQYYRKVAHNWEFQALLKARPIAGCPELCEQFEDDVSPFVWTAGARSGFVSEVRSMRRRVVSLIPKNELDRHIKLGPGGLRDVEFTVQLLQLVHGPHDEDLRVRSTGGALRILSSHNYLASHEARTLAAAYRFMRVVEHRLQIPRMAREAVLPERTSKLRALARSVYPVEQRSVDRLKKELAGHMRAVRALHKQIFYRPILDAATGSAHMSTVSETVARDRLTAFGYQDPAAAMRHIRALSTGLNRVAYVQRQVLPALLDWFSRGVDPDAGLVAFRRLSEGLSHTTWYLAMLRDSGVAVKNMARVLSLSRFASDLLISHPQSVQWLGNNERLQPSEPDAIATRMRERSRRRDDGVAAIRKVYGEEILRTSVADTLGLYNLDTVMTALTNAMDITVHQALSHVRRRLDAMSGIDDYQFCIIAMGRLGGAEIGYYSDADVMFVYEPGETLTPAQREALPSHAKQVALTLTSELEARSAEPIVDIDTDLRPEGKSGPLVRTLASYAKYYSTWSEPWEAQALLRARPIAGDQELGHAFVRLIDPLRYPQEVPESSIMQMRRLKARMESERLPRGGDKKRHLKLGTGGLSDVEWTVQMLQLQHAHTHPALRTTSTLEALNAATKNGLIDEDSAHKLEAAWIIASRVRSAAVLYKGRGSGVLPTDETELEAIALLLGYEPGGGYQLVEDYLGATRRARKVMEHVFFGFEPEEI